jgi:hypothetical protein
MVLDLLLEVRQLVGVVELGTTDEPECAQDVELIRMARGYFSEAPTLEFQFFFFFF